MAINIICALDQNNAIGKDKDLLFYLPDDLKHFKKTTLNHTIIMGRKTFESLPKGALPHRTNIVLTSQKDFSAPQVEVIHSFDELLSTCQAYDDIFIIGGSSVYEQALPYADRLYLTFIHAKSAEANVFFPSIDFSQWQLIEEEYHPKDEKHIVDFTFKTFKRNKL